MSSRILTSSNLRMFLHSSRNNTLAQVHRNPNPIHAIVGNESADLDSIVSSIIFAFHKQQAQNCTISNGDTNFVPIVNCKRNELSFRRDIVMCLDKLLIPRSDLVFFEEVVWDNVDFITLVDHNYPAPTQLDISPKIIEVIDHHVVDERARFSRMDVQTVGSCATLVSQHIMREGSILDKELSELVLSCIVADTNNFDPASMKTTQQDLDVAMIMLGSESERNSISTKNLAARTHSLYQSIIDQRSSLDGLSGEDLLRKDYKDMGKGLGISSVIIPDSQSNICESNQIVCRIINSMDSERRNKSLRLLLLLLAIVDEHGGVLRKDAYLNSGPEDGQIKAEDSVSAAKVLAVLESLPNSKRIAMPETYGNNCHGFTFGVEWARKKLAPLLV